MAIMEHILAPWRRQKGILGRLFGGKNLVIEIKNQTFTFSNVDEFRAFLAGKTEIPASKMQEIKQLSKVEKTINEKLAATIRDPKTVDSYLDDATMVRFSQDYDWRQIMFELSKQSTDYSEYKLEGVAFYVKYLQSRINVAQSILADKTKTPPDSDDKTRLLIDTMETSVLKAEDLQAAEEADEIENDMKGHFASTKVDLDEQKDEKITPSEFKRIPRGQTVIIDASSIPMIPMKIASRKFILDMSDPPKLIGKNGDEFPLKQGENLIGRSTKCSIVLNPELVDISRQHLIIELYPDKTLHFTDLSSSGSKLPADLIKI